MTATKTGKNVSGLTSLPVTWHPSGCKASQPPMFHRHNTEEGAKCFQNAPWYAIWMRSCADYQVLQGLESRGFTAYLPTQERMKGNRIVTATMFPGYLFARIPGDEFRPVLETPGVVQILGLGSRPEPVSEAEVMAIQNLSRLRPAAQVLERLATGQRVKIHTFGFEGFEGVVARIGGRDMVAVNVEILGRSVAVDIAAHELEIIRGEVKPASGRRSQIGMKAAFAC